MSSTTSLQPIRLLIADDHRLFRQGLRQICQTRGSFEIVGEAENGQVAVDLAHRTQPDVILMDIRMPVLDGVQATQLITAANPNIHVIVLTMHHEDRYVFDAIRAGARGYLLKDIDAHELLAAIHAVQQGDALIDPHIAAKVLDEFRRLNETVKVEQDGVKQLTEGESSVLQLVAQGLDNHEIAAALALAESTVANRLSTIYQKLHVNNRTQAALYALRRGWASLDAK